MSEITFSLDEGRVFGSRYYLVGPYHIKSSLIWWCSDEHLWDTWTNWLIDNMGPTPSDGIWTPNARWYANNGKFYFRNEKDRTLFLLKFS